MGDMIVKEILATLTQLGQSPHKSGRRISIRSSVRRWTSTPAKLYVRCAEDDDSDFDRVPGVRQIDP